MIELLGRRRAAPRRRLAPAPGVRDAGGRRADDRRLRRTPTSAAPLLDIITGRYVPDEGRVWVSRVPLMRTSMSRVRAAVRRRGSRRDPRRAALALLERARAGLGTPGARAPAAAAAAARARGGAGGARARRPPRRARTSRWALVVVRPDAIPARPGAGAPAAQPGRPRARRAVAPRGRRRAAGAAATPGAQRPARGRREPGATARGSDRRRSRPGSARGLAAVSRSRRRALDGERAVGAPGRWLR